MSFHPDPEPILAAVLTEHGPLSEADVITHLTAAGVNDAQDAVLELLEDMQAPAGQLPDDRWVWLPALLAGRVFTHRVSAAELACDVLTITPDLDPVVELCRYDGYQQLADGAPLLVVLPEFDAELLDERGAAVELFEQAGLLLAPGTLAGLGLAPGDLVGLSWDGTQLVLAPAEAGTVPGVGALLAAHLGPDVPVDFATVVWAVCVEQPGLFTAALAPLAELADAAGLVRDGESLAPAGFDLDRWHFDQDCRRLAHRYDLSEDDSIALVTLLAAHDRLTALVEATAEAGADLDGPDGLDNLDELETEHPDPAEAGKFADVLTLAAEALADPYLAQVLREQTADAGRRGAAALGMLAETLTGKVPRRIRAATHWLSAVALERLGDLPNAEAELAAAESADPDNPLVLLSLARIASDRGDVEAGLGLLRRAGAGDGHPLLDLLARHRVTARSDIGRNEPCWCGSGRKYKKCHHGNEGLPLPARVDWLYEKAVLNLTAGDWRTELLRVGLARLRHQRPFPADLVSAALADPVVVDALLFDGGVLAQFLAVRGALLPDDERLLAEQWALSERSVFEVEQARPGHSLTVRDVRTGDVVDVTERTASRALRPGQLICTRVLSTGAGYGLFGGVEPVALHQRDALIALLDDGPDPAELVEFLSARFAAPTVNTTAGDPMVVCEAQLAVADPAALTAALDERFERADDDGPGVRWHELAESDGMQRVLSTLSLTGDVLVVEANSEPRMDRVLAVLDDLDVGLALGRQTRTPITELLDAAGSVAPAGPTEPDSPELQAYMAQVIAGFEQRWLDESIPALGGVTPRQAAADPTRRDDLIRLLDTFPTGAAAGNGMDGDRLRAALGLH